MLTFYERALGYQIGYATVTLLLATGILFLLGLSIFHLLKIYSGRYLKNEDPTLLNIVFVGTILIALSQLFGPLIASTYPMVFGPDASDYRLSSKFVYCNISYNKSAGNYTFIATTDSSGMVYDYEEETNISIRDCIKITNKIYTMSLNPFMDYDNQILLTVVDSDIDDSDFGTYLSRPVLRVGQSSEFTIFLYRPPPNTYVIKLRGIGEDGKLRDTMMS